MRFFLCGSPRSLSVILEKNVFRCLATPCQASGNALDFWAQLHRLPIYEAALEIAQTFPLEITPNREEEPISQKTGTSPLTPIEI